MSQIPDFTSYPALEEIDKNLRLFSEIYEEAILVHKDGQILLVNDSFCSSFGYTREEVIGQSLELLTIEANVGNMLVRIKNKKEGSFDCTAKTKDGREFPAEIRTKNIHKDNMEVGVVGITDLTRRLGIEQKLIEAQQVQLQLAKRNHLILETTLDGFVLADTQGNIVDVNQRYSTLLGYAKEELLQMNMVQLEGVLSPEEVGHKIQSMLAAGGAQFETKHKHKLGGLVDLNVSISIMQHDDQQYVAAFCRDISEEKKTQKALLQLAKRDQLIVETALDGFVMVDIKGNILETNAAYQKMVGYTKEELKQMNIATLDALIRKKDLLVEVAEVFRKGGLIFESKNRTKNGEIINLQITSSILKYENQEYAISFCRDITEQKKAERQLQKSEEKFKSLFDYSFTGIGIIDNKENTIVFNDSMTRILGYSKKEFADMGVLDYTHPDDFAKDYAQYQRLLSGEINYYTLEKRYIHKLGQIVWGNLTVSAVRDRKGDILFTNAMIIDITEQKIAEIALQTSEQRYKQVVEDQSDLIARWKPGGYLVFVNDSYCKTFELDKEKVIGKCFFPLMQKNYLKQFKEDYAKLTPDNPSMTHTFRSGRKEKYLNYIEWVNHAFFDEKGEIIEVQAIGRDITHRVLAEQKLAENEFKYRSLFEKATDAIFLIDLTTFNLVDCNPKTLEMFGYANKMEFQKLQHFDLSPSMQLENKSTLDRFSEIGKALEKFGHHQTQWTFQRKDGTLFMGESSISLIYQDEKLFMQSIVRDITDRLESERKLKAAYEEVEALKKHLEQENLYLLNEVQLHSNFEDIVFGSAQFMELLQKVEQVAPVDATVLILGETGTGKELIARAVHKLSSRSNRALVRVNCAALPNALIESELFGHEKGAFTGAVKQKIGRFELANNGTIFLDEIGELPIEVQSKLLRVIQEGEFERIGGTQTLKMDVRIIAATNRDLQKEILEGNFREDLYYRLHVFPLEIPPLRARKDDITPLVSFFISKYSKKFNKKIAPISPASLQILENYDWPGNVRELENLIERALILAKEKQQAPFAQLMGVSESRHMEVKYAADSLKEAERRHILKILVMANWKINGSGGAAEILELTPTTVRDKMKKLGIKRPAK